MINKGEMPDPYEAAKLLYNEESWRQILSSLVVCFFARGIYDSETISNSLEAIGVLLDEQEMQELGSKILEKKLEFKIREGFKPEKYTLPQRILETDTPQGKIDEKYLRETIKAYYTFIGLG
jgi:aldehyde:ferredoxin oxidoreductase